MTVLAHGQRILDAPDGTWTEHPDDDDLWATYDLGVVEVPGEP